jgi:hypothetical protein
MASFYAINIICDTNHLTTNDHDGDEFLLAASSEQQQTNRTEGVAWHR